MLTALIDRVTRRLRAARRVCRTVVLRLRFQDYTRATRSRTMSEPTAQTHSILMVAHGLLSDALPMIERCGITLVGIALANLTDELNVQLSLPIDRARELDRAVDRVRDRFGTAAITRGVLVGQNPGLSVPLLPD